MGHKTKTRKVQTHQPGGTKKAKYRVKDWRAYNASLVERGSLTVWMSAEALAHWRPQMKGRRLRGGQTQYSAGAIECLLTLGAVLGLPLRQTEGFGRSVLGLLRADVTVPDYTTLCRRGKTLEVSLAVSRGEGPLGIVVDSTGLKVYGEGEWKVRQYGYAKRRIWRKLHLSVNALTQEIELTVLTEVSGDDAGTGSQMLSTLPDPIERVTGDGDYDKRKFYQTCTERQVSHVHIPPQRNARIWQHGNSAKPPLPRDQNLRRIRRIGRKPWKIETGYHRRSLVETAVFRFKTTFGAHLTSRLLASQQVEARIKCRALNIMAHLGLPDSYLVSV
jgi:hypothetical protein